MNGSPGSPKGGISQNKMGTMPVGKLLFSMAVPMTVSMLVQALYNIVDSYFVAKLSQDALNAVSLAFPLQSILFSFALGTGVGMSALISRLLGEKKPEGADRVAGCGILLFLICACVFCVLGQCLPRPFFTLQTDNQTIIDYGTDYLTVVMGICFFLYAQICFERLLQATGRTDKAMISQLTGAVVNMILDPLFIFGYAGFPRLEVKGAAIATVIGQGTAAAVGLFLNLKYNPDLHFSFRLIRLRKQAVAEIYRIGFPSILIQSVGSFTTFFLNRILIGFTEAATAVYGAYFKLQSFVFMPVFGLNNAMVPIIAYNYGAARRERVHRTFRLSVISAVSFMGLGMIVFLLLPGVLIGLFSPTPEMSTIGIRALRIICVHFPVAGFCIMAGSVCQAIGNPFHSLLITIARQIVVLLPAAWLLSLSGVLDNVWFCFPIAEVVSCAMSVIFLRHTFKKAEERFRAEE